jgi:hypothetical protein
MEQLNAANRGCASMTDAEHSREEKLITPSERRLQQSSETGRVPRRKGVAFP